MNEKNAVARQWLIDRWCLWEEHLGKPVSRVLVVQDHAIRRAECVIIVGYEGTGDFVTQMLSEREREIFDGVSFYDCVVYGNEFTAHERARLQALHEARQTPGLDSVAAG